MGRDVKYKFYFFQMEQKNTIKRVICKQKNQFSTKIGCTASKHSLESMTTTLEGSEFFCFSSSVVFVSAFILCNPEKLQNVSVQVVAIFVAHFQSKINHPHINDH